MKKIFFVLTAIAGFTSCCFSQRIDTVITYNFGKMPPYYGMDKLFWERNFDDSGHFLFEALRYNNCFTGAFIEYRKNGQVMTRGQYLQNTTGDWTHMLERGLCSVQVGEWKNYDEAGKYSGSIYYDKGKIAAVPPIDTVITSNFGKMPPVYFSNKVYWERNYDEKNHLLFEGLKYNSCFTGYFIEYGPTGKVKTRGQYMENNTGDWSDLKNRGFCSVMDGEWKNYDGSGSLKRTVVYEKGKLIREY